MSQRQRAGLPSIIVFGAVLLAAAGGQAAGAARIVPLRSNEAAGDAAQSSGQTSVVLANKSVAGLTLKFAASTLEITDRDQDGVRYQQLNLPGAQLDGAAGAPALPLLTRLVAVPDGQTLALRQVRPQVVAVDGVARPWPTQGLQPADAREFVIDRDLYAGAKQAAAAPLVSIGEPGLLRGVRVVPVRFRPATWRAATGQLEIAADIEAEFDFVPAADKAVSSGRPLPQSFASLLRDEVIGYQVTGEEMTVPGTYLLIYPNDPALLGKLQPLIDWRQRQGYHVVVASTAQTGTTTASIKAYLQNQYDTLTIPLEFVTLVGDATGTVSIPTFIEGLSGYSGEGDHEYTLLEGGDVLADVHLGRLSVDSADMLATVVGKIVAYESSPFMAADPGWYTRAGLTGDPSSSGYSTIWVNQWVKQQLLKLNYTQVDTIWGGNYTVQMMANINQGESIFTYRGYYGMSGMSYSHIGTLSNGQKLPFALILTCDTGSFRSDATCRSEAFLRAANGGGVAAIGTATIGTHTRYNNCMFQGVAEGVLNHPDPRVGPGLTRGKLHLYENYIDQEPDRVMIWSTWNNLMGDPATAVWTAVPRSLAVTYPANLTSAANSLPVNVTSGGQPEAGALVTVFRAGVLQVSAVTGNDGHVNLPLSGLTDGVYQLTVTGRNLLPHQGGLNVGALAAAVHLAAVQIDDDNTGASAGNSSGVANPGETVELAVDLMNHGTGAVNGVSAVLTSPDARVSVVQDTADFGFISNGGTASGLQSFVVAVDAALPGGTIVPLELTATDGVASWTSLVELTVSGAAAAVQGVTISGGALDPGDSATLTVTLDNIGDLAAAGATAVLTSSSRWVIVSDDSGTFGALPAGGSVANAGDTFGLGIDAGCFPGHVATLNLALTFAEGGTVDLPVLVTVGTALSTDPRGPDRYGYYAFDNTDTGYAPLAPAYDWVEISPSRGGAGTSVGLQDFARYSDDVVVMDLPFPFTYYGQSFTKLSVCSNGWISLGATDLRHYRNWTLPSPGTPDNLIAVYWDDLMIQASGSGIYAHHDVAGQRLIIQWDHVANAVTGAVETFQVVLDDPAYRAGDTGDGIITMNYLDVTPTDAETGYATVGIQNGPRDDAVLYTYYNMYPAGAAVLGAGRSITFRTYVPQTQGVLRGMITADGSGAAVDGATISVIGAGRSVLSAGNGAFVASLPLGTYDVAVHHPSFAPDTTFGVLVEEAIEAVVDFALVDIAGPVIALQTMPGSTGDTAGPYDVVFTAADYSGVGQTRFLYTSSSSGGPFELAPQPEGPADTWRVSIPGQPGGTLVQYWLTSEDLLGHTAAQPVGAPFAVNSFMVSQTTVLYTSDMENATDWTAGDPSDQAASGLWVNVDPNAVMNGAVEVSPENDHSPVGTMCWITGNDPIGAAQGTDDVDGGTTTLLSPVFDVAGQAALEVQYRRWYTNDTGNAPAADYWVVQAQAYDGSWVDLENTVQSDRSWQLQSFILGEHLTVGSNLAFRFLASDVGSGSVVEAGVDDFVLSSIALVSDTTAPQVSGVTPAGGESLVPGASAAITWSQSDDVGVVHVEIRLSTDAGASFGDPLAAGPFNGSFDWTVPGTPGAANRLKVTCYDAAGRSTEAVSAADFAIGGASAVGDLPAGRLGLAQNSPNPFNPRTEIRFSLPTRQDVSLRIYDVEGRLVRTLVQGRQDAGEHAITWSGRNEQGGQTASGLYFYRLVTEQGTLTRKMTLLK